VHKPQDKSNV